MKGEIEGSNAFAGTVWEGELLKRHFAPSVREAVMGVDRNVREAMKG
jgi:nucleolar complex protein 3